MVNPPTPSTPPLTRNQALVFQVLTQSAAPLSAYTILTGLQSHGLRAPTQVYRALDKLLDLGLVHKLETLNAFVACNHTHAPSQGATVFAICNDCGEVAEFADPSIDARLQTRAADEHFQLDAAIVELRGRCRLCSAAIPPPEK